MWHERLQAAVASFVPWSCVEVWGWEIVELGFCVILIDRADVSPGANVVSK